MQLAELVATSTAVAGASARLEKIDRLASVLRRVPPEEIAIAVAFLSGSARDRAQGRIGVGGAAIIDARAVPAAVTATLELRDVADVFERVAGTSGSGSGAAKVGLLRDLLGRATADEQDFLVRLLFGELRQGAVEGVLLEAVARASGIPAARVRRAAMLAGALAPVAHAALAGDGDEALARFMLQPFHPVQPMLADSAADVGEALATLGEASLEYKLDGARIQVHKAGEAVKVFTRNLRDVTHAVPEVVEIVRANPSRDLILDGEVLALGPNRTPHPFQVTMRRFGRKLDVDRLRQELPLTPFFFDCLYADGDPLVEEPLSRRVATLAAAVDAQFLVPRIMTAKPDEAAAFLDRAIATGHEGVMAKAPAGTYAAGRRGQAWLKIKRARTLDLVVLAAEWGHGRRHGTLSNLHLGAPDPERGGFVMLGKTFKGLTDDMLAWQTKNESFFSADSASSAVDGSFRGSQGSECDGGGRLLLTGPARTDIHRRSSVPAPPAGSITEHQVLRAFGISDTGRIRPTNEDCFAIDEDRQLCVVADGMGGHNAGEVAARMAVDTVVGFVRAGSADAALPPEDTVSPDGDRWPFGFDWSLSLAANRLRTAIQLANRHILAAATADEDLSGMGTTVVAALIAKHHLTVAHVGDSRLYLLDHDRLWLLTHDDSWLATVLAEDPKVDPAILQHHPMRNALTNVVGARKRLEVHVVDHALGGGERLLLSTDGVHGVLDNGHLEKLLGDGDDLDRIAKQVVHDALRNGSRDNCTAVVARYTRD